MALSYVPVPYYAVVTAHYYWHDYLLRLLAVTLYHKEIFFPTYPRISSGLYNQQTDSACKVHY